MTHFLAHIFSKSTTPANIPGHGKYQQKLISLICMVDVFIPRWVSLSILKDDLLL